MSGLCRIRLVLVFAGIVSCSSLRDGESEKEDERSPMPCWEDAINSTTSLSFLPFLCGLRCARPLRPRAQTSQRCGDFSLGDRLVRHYRPLSYSITLSHESNFPRPRYVSAAGLRAYKMREAPPFDQRPCACGLHLHLHLQCKSGESHGDLGKTLPSSRHKAKGTSGRREGERRGLKEGEARRRGRSTRHIKIRPVSPAPRPK